MPHNRQRHAATLILKKLKFNPVLTIQGARQTGKSLLAREILIESLPKLEYTSLDQYKTFEFASSNPGLFLAQHEDALPLVIDEAQKVPRIFDEVKFEVDQEKSLVKYLLLGSTEFSKMTLIRESLTGRMGRVRLFPLNLAETYGLEANSSSAQSLTQKVPRISRSQLLNYLDRGGMPGIFAVRNSGDRHSLMQDWLDLTTQRDVSLIPKIKVDIVLCRRILEQIAVLEDSDAGSIARVLKVDCAELRPIFNA